MNLKKSTELLSSAVWQQYIHYCHSTIAVVTFLTLLAEHVSDLKERELCVSMIGKADVDGTKSNAGSERQFNNSRKA